MSLETLLLSLRVIITLALYVFLGLLLWYVWRDVRLSSQYLSESRKLPGQLTIVECDPEVPLTVGTVFQLRSSTTLGRSPTSTIPLADSYASTNHAQIIWQGGQWWLHDLQSRNGTAVNGIPISEAVVLASGDIITIGRVQFKLDIE
jgi:hypothetical protein